MIVLCASKLHFKTNDTYQKDVCLQEEYISKLIWDGTSPHMLSDALQITRQALFAVEGIDMRRQCFFIFRLPKLWSTAMDYCAVLT